MEKDPEISPLNEYTKNIIVQVLEKASSHLLEQIDTVKENKGTMHNMAFKAAQSTYQVLEKMAFCLGVLLPTRHQSVLESLFQRVENYLEVFEENRDFRAILEGDVDSNYFNRQTIRQIEEEKERIAKELFEARMAVQRAEAEKERAEAQREQERLEKARIEREKLESEQNQRNLELKLEELKLTKEEEIMLFKKKYQNLEYELGTVKSELESRQRLEQVVQERQKKAQEEQEQAERRLLAERTLNFEVDVTLTVEKVIRATFLNPDRRKFAQSKAQGSNFQLHPDNVDPEALIQRIAREIPQLLRKFNEQKIQLFDTSRLKQDVNKTQWLEDLKKLKWYGPFMYNNNGYTFQTATDSGNFEGFFLDITLTSPKLIQLFFLNKSSQLCGTYYHFS